VLCAGTAGPAGHRDAGKAGARAERSIPILEYHAIGFHAAGSPLEGLWVTPAELRRQVDWLASHGWHSVTLGQAAAYWRGAVPLPPKPVVLSFDDGYPGDWRYALPILRDRNFVGVLNLQIGNMVALHVRQLIRAGWEIDAHTFTHPDLRKVSNAQLFHEVLDARFWIEREFYVPVPAFCYPFGFYDARVVAMVREAGYEVAETENYGRASPADGLLTLDRLRVMPGLSPRAFAALLG